MGTLNSYNFGIVEDTYKLFAPNGVFAVMQSNGVIQIYPRPIPCCHGNENWEFFTENGL